MSAVAEALRAAQRLRRGPLAALLGLPLLLALAAPAAAQEGRAIPEISIHRQGTLVPGQGMSYAVVEGNPASFLVTVSTDWRAPKPLTVTLDVSEDTRAHRNYVTSADEGRKTMTIHPWQDGASKLYEVSTKDGSGHLPDGAVTVRLVPMNGYTVSPGHSQATVEVADNDKPQGLILRSSTPMFGGLTMAEGGGGGYTVRLASRPTGAVTVTVTARDDGDGDGDWSNVRVKSQSQSQRQNLSESQILSLTFTQDDWHIPQRIDVFSQADDGYENDRFSLVHTPSGGGYGSSETGYMRVGVVDNPPPPPSSQSVPDNWALKPSGIGVGGQFRLLFLTASRNASDSSIDTYNSFVQTQAAGGHTNIQSYSSQFKVVGSTASISARDNTNTTGAGTGIPIYWLNGDKIADDYDDFWDGSWEAQMSSDTRGADGMGVSGALRVWTGTQTNGGTHANSLGSSNVRYGEWGSGTDPISNGTDDGSGGRRMLALSPVFEVSSGAGFRDGDSIGSSDSTDSVEDDGGTETSNTPRQPDYSALKDTVRGYAEETQHGDEHVSRWKRALAGLGDEDAIAEGYTPMTADEAQDMADTYSAGRWNPIVEALTDLESRQTAEPEPEPEPDPIPALSLSGGSAVDEGASASFTIHADPAPASDVTVSVTVAQSGDWLDSPGAGTRAVTLAAGATTASLAVATVNDSADEPDGSVSVTLDTGTGYTVASSPNDTASVTVRDDDDPPPPPPAIAQGTCVSVAQWNTVKGYYDSNANRSPNYGANWYRVLIAYQQDRGDQTLPDWEGATAEPAAAFTAAAAGTEESKWVGWTPVRIVLQCLEKTYGGISTDSVIGGVPPMGQSGEVGTANPDGAMKRNRWNPETGPGGFEPDALMDFAAGSCVSPRLRSEAAARANETWRGPAHVERWLRVGQTFSGGANDATVVTPAEAGFHAAAGQPGWLPVADALRCMEQQSLREAMSR